MTGAAETAPRQNAKTHENASSWTSSLARCCGHSATVFLAMHNTVSGCRACSSDSDKNAFRPAVGARGSGMGAFREGWSAAPSLAVGRVTQRCTFWVRFIAFLTRVLGSFRQLSAPSLFLLAFAAAVISRPQTHYIVGRFLVLSVRKQTLGVAFQFLDALL